MGPAFVPVEDNGYTSPDFELLSSDEEVEPRSVVQPPSKRQRTHSKQSVEAERTLEEEEQLALQILRGGR